LILELEHHVRRCGVKPNQVPLYAIATEFDLKVLPHLRLDDGWRRVVLACLDTGYRTTDEAEVKRLDSALAHLRELYMWGDIDTAEYQAKRDALERQRKSVASRLVPQETPNLDRAAQLLRDLPTLWHHPGVLESQRQALLQEVFEGIYIEGRKIMAVEPRPQYKPLFAYTVSSAATVSGVRPSPLAPTITNPIFLLESLSSALTSGCGGSWRWPHDLSF